MALGVVKFAGLTIGWWPVQLNVWLFSICNIVLFTFVIWWTTALLYRADQQRALVEHRLRRSNQQLERRVAERTTELTASENLYRQLADAMPQIVWAARPDGYFDYYNERWYEFTGFSRDECGDPSWMPILHPDDLRHCLDTWYGAVRAGTPYEIEYRFWDRHHCRFRWFLGRALPVKDAGRIVRWFGTCTDIDGQKQLEEALRQANEDLNQFAYSASHDLREPLRMVAVYSQLLTRRYEARLDADAHQYLAYMVQGAHRMEALIRDLLAYTQTGTSDVLQLGVLDCNLVLQKVLANLKMPIEESGAMVDGKPLPVIRAHEVHVVQLFQNLIGNALKYRGSEPPVICITAEQQGAQWTFSVQDNGIGIAAEYQQQIFGVFKRLHAAHRYAGTGIGLAICKRIVERYGGRIWVESGPSRGSVFRFTLPAGMFISKESGKVIRAQASSATD
ncbi:MAG: sensor histidine kinase [Bryobacteraceae bacterium]